MLKYKIRTHISLCFQVDDEADLQLESMSNKFYIECLSHAMLGLINWSDPRNTTSRQQVPILTPVEQPISMQADLWPDAPYILLIGCLLALLQTPGPPAGKRIALRGARIIAPTSSWSDTL